MKKAKGQAGPSLGLLVLLGLFSCLFSPTQAIYDDEIGKIEWFSPQLGRITAATQLENGNIIVSSSHSNLIALLDSSSGAFLWRQVLPEGQIIQKNLVCQSSNVVTKTETSLFYWDALTGSLLWTVSLTTDEEVIDVQCVKGKSAENDVAVLGTSSLFLYFGPSGSLSSSTALPPSTTSLALLVDQDQKISVLLKGSEGIKVQSFDLSSSSSPIASSLLSSSSFPPSSLFSFISSNEALVVSSQDKTIQVTTISKNEKETKTSFSFSSLSSLSISDITVVNQNQIQVSSENKELLLVLTRKGQGESWKEIAKKEDQKMISPSPFPALFWSTSSTSSSGSQKIKLQMFSSSEKTSSSSSSQTEIEIDFELDDHHGSPSSVLSLSPTSFLLITQDSSLHLLSLTPSSGVEKKWAREESLTEIDELLFVGRKTGEGEGSKGKTGMGMSHRLALQINDLHRLVLRLLAFLSSLFPSDPSSSSSVSLEGEIEEADHDGFKKIVAAVSSSGKISAFPSDQPLLLSRSSFFFLWRRFIPEFSQLLHFSVSPDAHSLLLFFLNKEGETKYEKVEVTTGKVVDQKTFGQGIHRIERIHKTSSSSSTPIFVGFQTKGLETVVKTLKISEGEQALPSDIYSTQIEDKKEGKGFLMKGLRVGPLGGLERTWQMEFSGESLLALSRPVVQPSSLAFREMADGSLLPRYVNPFLSALVSLSLEDSKPSVRLYLLDSVSGRLLFHLSLSNAEGPAKAMISENNVMFFYWNRRTLTHEVVSLELFGTHPITSMDMVGKALEGSVVEDKTSFSKEEVQVAMKTYSLTDSFALGMSITKRGLTPKNLLLATAKGQVVAVDARYLDPLRPMAGEVPSKATANLAVYHPEIPMFPSSFLSHSHLIQRPRHILTTDANLESTSLVICWGLDLFFSRFSPSSTFDVLSADFDYASLSFSIVVVLFATFLTRRLANNKTLTSRWN